MRAIMCLLAALALVPVVVAPAFADARIGLSRDGVTFAPTLSSTLFDPDLRWVPGDSRTATFYVRNQADEPATLSVDVVGTHIDSLLETGYLTISVRGGGGRWRETSATGTHRLVSEIGVGTGDSARIDVSVAFAPEATNPSQTQNLALAFRILLSQDVEAAVAPDRDGLLPDTGAPASWSFIIGLTLVGAGTILVHKRREEAGTDVQS
ncbi:LPXTG cell wall anchor domain-containing protein [Aeromicrobium sp. A1-2]|uniref:LPXTG cell wall anchor domain-containing protein n=1 Tax=Aeromicrobium sp. A1-2 TaxID=2107713 RepID=UPI0020B17376|nr:LPXTG cell wall anchor domain-containing protein [Aeromicrobium sp. A1-2]